MSYSPMRSRIAGRTAVEDSKSSSMVEESSTRYDPIFMESQFMKTNPLLHKAICIFAPVCLLFLVSSSAHASPPKRRIPNNSFSAPTSQPVASKGFFFTPAVEFFFANATPAHGEVDIVARVLIRGGDIASAQQLIPFCGSDNLHMAGLVAAYSPEPTIANAKRIRGA